MNHLPAPWPAHEELSPEQLLAIGSALLLLAASITLVGLRMTAPTAPA